MSEQQMIEEERQFNLLLIFAKLQMAQRDGYLNEQDMADIQHEFGIITKEKQSA